MESDCSCLVAERLRSHDPYLKARDIKHDTACTYSIMHGGLLVNVNAPLLLAKNREAIEQLNRALSTADRKGLLKLFAWMGKKKLSCARYADCADCCFAEDPREWFFEIIKVYIDVKRLQQIMSKPGAWEDKTNEKFGISADGAAEVQKCLDITRECLWRHLLSGIVPLPLTRWPHMLTMLRKPIMLTVQMFGTLLYVLAWTFGALLFSCAAGFLGAYVTFGVRSMTQYLG